MTAALGLYDANALHAEEQLQLLEFLVGLGASEEDLLEYRDQLPAWRRSLVQLVPVMGAAMARVADAAVSAFLVDLVGSTLLAERLSPRELGAVLTEFENTAADTVTANDGRVVKLIGDEVLYTAPGAAEACRIALSLTRSYREHPRVPKVRAGVAGGEVLLRDGDVFGPGREPGRARRQSSRSGRGSGPRRGRDRCGQPPRAARPAAAEGLDGQVELARIVDQPPDASL